MISLYRYKILVALSFDVFLSIISTFISYSVRNEAIERIYVSNLYLINEYHAVTMSDINVYVINILVFIPIFFYFGIYILIINVYFNALFCVGF